MTMVMGAYHFSVFALPNFITAFLILSLAVWVRYFEGPTHIGTYFIGFGIAAAVWLGAFGIAYTANTASLAQQWIEITQFGVLALPPILHGLLSQLFRFSGWRQRINGVFWLVSLSLAVLLVTHTGYFQPTYHYWWGYYAHFGTVGIISSFYMITTLTWLAFEGVRVSQRLRSESITWKRVRLVLIGFSVAFLAAVDYLPAWGIPCYPFGYLMVLALIGIVGYATWRYRLISITPETASRQILSNLSDGVCVVDETGHIALANQRAEELLGVHQAEILGQSAMALSVRLGITEQVNKQLLLYPDGKAREVRLTLPDGKEQIVELTGRALLSRHDEILFVVWVVHDVTDYRRAVEENHYMAYHSHLTDLPNRALILKRVKEALLRLPSDGSESIGVLKLGLNQFSYINNTLGLGVGDQILKIVAKRLQTALGPEDTLAHIGADVFAILVESDATRSSVIELVKRLEASLSQRILLQGQMLTLRASIGVTLANGIGRDADILLREANTAMHKAKSQAMENPVFYVAAMREMLQEWMDMKQGLEQAIIHNEFIVYYQPQIDMTTSQVIGFEALVRWQHPQRGLLSPGAFLDVAEETGMLAQLDAWVLQAAIRQLASWHELLPASHRPRLSINLSPSSLRRGQYKQQLNSALKSIRMPASYLTVEITESTLMGDTETVMTELAAFRDLGVGLSVDDFGTGYASLAYLKRFPVTEVKIDSSFVNDLVRDGNNDTAIVQAIIALGRALKLNIVAEGVESEAQSKKLCELGCRHAQGYWYAPALSPDKAWELLNHEPWQKNNAHS